MHWARMSARFDFTLRPLQVLAEEAAAGELPRAHIMSPTPAITARSVPGEPVDGLVRHGIHPLLARLYAARGITAPQQIACDSIIWPRRAHSQPDVMAQLMADAICGRKRLLIVAATTPMARRHAPGAARVDRLRRHCRVPGAEPIRVRGRAHDGDRAARSARSRRIPDPVDKGSPASRACRRPTISAWRCDHGPPLPAASLPEAAGIVNPNQPVAAFPAALAASGVFYVMPRCARNSARRVVSEPQARHPQPSPGGRRERRAAAGRTERPEPNLAALLDCRTGYRRRTS